MLAVVFVILVVAFPALGLTEMLTISCDQRDAFRCANGECIYRFAWCDGVPDCTDFSDEKFCHGADCSADYFQCAIGGCIPMSGVCDEYADCIDGSDEVACENFYPTDDVETVSKAARFFLDRMTENGWENFTPRAVVALSFADRSSPIGAEEKALMVKQLDIYLKAGFIHKSVKTLSYLAFSINALYATCQDPRNFQGEDLVTMLRSQTNQMKASSVEYPSALLTLCIADQVDHKDIDQLMTMYWNSNIMSFKALVIMAMACIGNKTGNVARNEIDDFIASDQSVRDADIYTKALYLQAVHAAGSNSSIQISNLQLPDGSFGDMLATYSALPALLRSSLLDLRCNSSKHEGFRDVRSRFTNDESKKLVYSLWIPSDTGNNTHTMVLRFEGNVTFYDIMLMAAARDPIFSFLCDETVDGKKVYSLAGIPNDAETGKSWVLHEATTDMVSVYTPHYLRENNLGVDKIYIGSGNYFVFWLKQ